MRRKSRKVKSLNWRVKSYDGEYLEHGSSLPFVAEISGKITNESIRSIQANNVQQRVLALVRDLDSRRCSRRHPLTPFAQVSSYMTVRVEQLHPADRSVARLILRLDLTREGNRAFGSLLVADQPRIDLKPVDINPSDGVLDVFLRMLSYMLPRKAPVKEIHL